MARIGFIGLGHMGLPMAINLIKSGHTVVGFDLQPSAIRALVMAGGIAARDLPHVAHEQDVIVTMLQTGQQVADVCLNDNGLFALAKKGALYIDCSSIDVASSRHLHQQAERRHLLAVDAPVSGGVTGATQASLTIMVGGNEFAFAKAKTILHALGRHIIHTGDAGSGQAAKICNNMILGISMIAVSEAFTLAKHLQLDAKKLFEVVNQSSGKCWVIDHYVPVSGLLDNVPANHNYQPGFTANMMLKDLNLSQAAATTTGITTTMGQHAAEYYQRLSDNGMGDLDFSAIIKLME